MENELKRASNQWDAPKGKKKQIAMIHGKNACFQTLTSKFMYKMYLDFNVNVLKHVFFLMNHHK